MACGDHFAKELHILIIKVSLNGSEQHDSNCSLTGYIVMTTHAYTGLPWQLTNA